MPIPVPNPGESERNFISRCIRELKKIDPERPIAQVTAICYRSWDTTQEEKKASPELVRTLATPPGAVV